MRSGRERLVFGVDRVEVEAFMGDSYVEEFLAKFKGRMRTFDEYGRVLCMFFKWLRVVKGLSFSPGELLNEHVRRHGSLDIEDRRWALKLVLEFSRDNPVWSERSDGYKYHSFTVIKGFFDYHEADLTSDDGVFGKRKKRKYKPEQASVAEVKKILGCLGQRDRTICMVMLQSGQGVGEILNKFNYMLDYVVNSIKGGAQRIRIDFEERKGNDFNYFSFISRDAIQELQKWLIIRAKWLEGKADPGAIFITKRGKLVTVGKPVTVGKFESHFNNTLQRLKLKKGPFATTPHMFRKLFKTESRPPERNIDQDCIEFMMGHLSGIESIGGVYDKTPELYAGVIEREYAKLEPYINIYSGKAAETEGLGINEEDMASLKQLLQMMKEGKIKIEP